MTELLIFGYFLGLQPLAIYLIANYSIEISRTNNEDDQDKI